MVAKFQLIILFFALTCHKLHASNFYSHVANFCFNNGGKQLIISGSSQMKNDIFKLAKTTQRHYLRIGYQSLIEIPTKLKMHQDYLLLLADGRELNKIDFLPYLMTIQHAKVKRAVIVITTPIDQDQETSLINLMNSVSENALFYLIYQQKTSFSPHEILYKQVISIKHASRAIVEDFQINELGQVIEKYNLQGLNLYGTTLSWAPTIMIENCDSEGKNCETRGLYRDLMDAMSKVLNFTWECHKEVNNNWGVSPIIEADGNKTWVGLFGSIVNGDYMFSPCSWQWNIVRYGLVDFVSTTWQYRLHALTPKNPEIDYGLLVRCFTNETWNFIAIITVILFIFILLPYNFIQSEFYEQTNGYILASFSGWMFFVMLEIFYGGALTMFFTTEVRIEFESTEDVLRAYPDWKILIKAGTEIDWIQKANTGDPLFVDFLEMLQKNPDEFTFTSLEDGLKALQNERAVMHIESQLLRGYFTQNLFFNQRLKMFGRTRTIFNAMPVPINSPLKPILQTAVTNLVEGGAIDYMTAKWEGKDIPDIPIPETEMLTVGQLILPWTIHIGLLSLCFSIFITEIIWSKFKKQPDLKTDLMTEKIFKYSFFQEKGA